jgi:vacuolar-type H+-ATPase subunit H
MTNTTARFTNAASSGVEAARDAFSDTRDSIGEAGDAMRKAAKDTVREAKSYGRENAGKAVDAAQDLGQAIMSYASKKPVQAALIGVGGLLLASLILRRR